MHDVLEIAKWFTQKNGGSIESKKLQKLCYYAQAWSYAVAEDIAPIIQGDFQAWVHGPVHCELWEYFKDIAYREITLKDFPKTVADNFSELEKEHLESVWLTYGHLTGAALEYLSHQEKPWQEKRVGLSDYEPGWNVIRPESMRDYYRSVYVADGVK